LAQDAPKATATSAPPPMSGSVELAISVIESNADERAKAFANQMLMEAMRKQAEDDGIVIDD
jgi:7-keto-8-aminopelargonate synthetase-like enzyme